jgi:hypothetical protein
LVWRTTSAAMALIEEPEAGFSVAVGFLVAEGFAVAVGFLVAEGFAVAVGQTVAAGFAAAAV